VATILITRIYCPILKPGWVVVSGKTEKQTNILIKGLKHFKGI
jgi:hypothetical protein